MAGTTAGGDGCGADEMRREEKARPGGGVGKRFREDKEMGRKVLTSTDLTTAK